MIVKPFNKPESQFTQLHNSIFDVIMRECTPNEWQVLCAVIRKTRGWDKAGDKISYSQIMDLTGIASKSTISKAIQGLVQKNMVATTGSYGSTTYYRLNQDYTIEQNNPTGTVSVPVEEAERDQYRNCTGTSTDSGLPTSTDSVHTKDLKSLNKERLKNQQPSLFLKKLIHHYGIDPSPTNRKIVKMLKRCRPSSNGNGTLILSTPEPDDCAWMSDRLSALLKRELAGIAGQEIDVQFELLEGPTQ